MLENLGAGASEGHLPLVPRSNAGDTVEGTEVHEERCGQSPALGGTATDKSRVRSSFWARTGSCESTHISREPGWVPGKRRGTGRVRGHQTRPGVRRQVLVPVLLLL